MENHNLKNIEDHYKKLEEQMQILQQEFQESLVDQQTKWQEQFGKQNRRTGQISAQIETLSTQFQTVLGNQMIGKDLGSTSGGILQTPERGSPEGMLLRGKGPPRGDQTYGQEQHRVVHNVVLPRMDLTTFWGDNPRGWLRRCGQSSEPPKYNIDLTITNKINLQYDRENQVKPKGNFV